MESILLAIGNTVAVGQPHATKRGEESGGPSRSTGGLQRPGGSRKFEGEMTRARSFGGNMVSDCFDSI